MIVAIIRTNKKGGEKSDKQNTMFKILNIFLPTRENNVEVSTIDKPGEKALEYSPWLLSGMAEESLKVNTDTAGCKQTVTAVKHLLQEVSKVQTFQLQRF